MIDDRRARSADRGFEIPERIDGWLAVAASRSRLGWLGVALALFLAGCGSGSSGFDPEVSAAAQGEQSAIQDAAQHGTCALEPNDFRICGGGVPPLAGAPAIPEPTSDSGVSIQEGIRCAPGPLGCAFTLRIVPTGFPAGTSFLGAVRPADYSAPWRTGIDPFQPSTVTVGILESHFTTDLKPGVRAIVAFLSFAPKARIPEVMPMGIDVDVLTELGAARADVIVDVPLLPPGG